MSSIYNVLGTPLKESSIFAQVKQLMTTVKTQLAHFTRYQKQQRHQIASFTVESKTNQDGFSSQRTYKTKCKLLELAAQQKELLKLFQGHKNLFEKIQMLKEKAKTVAEHVLPAVEMHCKSYGAKNMQLEIKENSAVSSASMTMLASNINLSSDTVCIKTINCATSTCLQPLTLSTASQFTTLEDQTQPCHVMTSCSPTNGRHVSTTTHTSVNCTLLQSSIQDTVLTGHQVHCVEGKQVYMLPQELDTSVVTTARLSSNTKTSASATETRLTTANVSDAQSGTSCIWLSGIPMVSSLVSSVDTPVLSSSVSLQPMSYPSTSSTLQSSLMPSSENSSQVLKQATHAGRKTTPSQVSSMNSMTVSELQPRAWAKSSVNIPSQITSAVPSKLQATKTTSTPLKGPVSITKNLN